MATSYTPYYSGGWQSGEEGNTPITPDALNHMDEGIGDAFGYVDDSQKGAAIGALLTNRSPYFEYHYAMKFGGVIILSFLVKNGAPNGTTLCNIDNSIKPAAGDYIAPLFYGNGQMVTNASVWIEHGDTTLVKYYGATATAGAYVTLIYGIE